MDLPPRPTLFDFHGVSMVKYFTDNWDNVQSFRARPDDILIATYPKAGTTWVSYMLDLLYFDDTVLDWRSSVPLQERVPFLEISAPSSAQRFNFKGKDLADQLSTAPRLIKTHLPVQFVPKSFWEQRSRIVYVARNAKDTAVSYFHFGRMNHLHPETGDWSCFLQNFIKGNMVFGSWYQHVNAWWDKKLTCSNIHYMFYEDLIEDSGREIDRLCSFLGLSPTVEQKERVRAKAAFDNMKQNKITNFSTLPLMNQTVSSFYRKGAVGDWKNHFTVAQNEQFDEDYKSKMKNPGLFFRTEI